MRIKQLMATVTGVVAIGGVTAMAADQMSVQVKTTQVRDSGSYLGKPLYELHFGDRVLVLDKGAAWFKVQPVNAASGQLPDQAGYINKSALTTKRVVLKADQRAQSAASAENVTLAGKGFNEDVERSYQAEHPNLGKAYAELNQIENNSIYAPTAEQINAFRAAGRLNGGGK